MLKSLNIDFLNIFLEFTFCSSLYASQKMYFGVAASYRLTFRFSPNSFYLIILLFPIFLTYNECFGWSFLSLPPEFLHERHIFNCSGFLVGVDVSPWSSLAASSSSQFIFPEYELYSFIIPWFSSYSSYSFLIKVIPR